MENNLKAVDFFCSGGGMTNGFTKAGIDVIAGIDIDIKCKETYEKNNKNSKFICKDIFEYSEKELIKDVKIKRNDDNMIFIGCSPCQYWSIINTNKQKAEKSKSLLTEFTRFVKFFRPGYVVVENVPGISRNKSESGLGFLLKVLEKLGYNYDYGIFNLNEYGVPQNRKRFSLIATRLNKSVTMPEKSSEKYNVKDFLGVWNGFPSIGANHMDATDFNHTTSKLSEENIKVVINTPIGSEKSFKQRSKYSKQGFKDSYCRMYWDRPAPTITTKFYSISNGRFIHPEENRGISIREGATLQTFPKDYVFYGTKIQIGKMIGNAVPPEFAYRIGKGILLSHGETEKKRKQR